MSSHRPLDVVALSAASCGSVLWRAGSSLRVTVVVKATFALAPEGEATLLPPSPLEREDQHVNDDPARSLRVASEVAPYMPSAGVVLTGHAYAPGGEPVSGVPVRLGVYREGPLFEKTIHVFGDVDPKTGLPGPFVRMPLVYERAFGGPDAPENPVGVGASGPRRPNLLDPTGPERPTGFGPIAPAWPHRRRLFEGAPVGGAGSLALEIPSGFDFRAYNPAPVDQQVPFLRGDEWIVMDNLCADLPRVRTRLPSAHARARYHVITPAGASPGEDIVLVADMLVLDTDRQTADLVWRGSFAPESAGVLSKLRLFAGVELPGMAIPWPEPSALENAPGAVATSGGRRSLLETSPEVIAPSHVLPFREPEPGRPPPVFQSAPPPSSPRAEEGGDPLEKTARAARVALKPALPFQSALPAPPPAQAPPPPPPPPAPSERRAPARTAVFEGPAPDRAFPFAVSRPPSVPPPQGALPQHPIGMTPPAMAPPPLVIPPLVVSPPPVEMPPAAVPPPGMVPPPAVVSASPADIDEIIELDPPDPDAP